ncbi:ArnT family glycosyltransferase [Flagellimonas sp.]|uniref:ArnT family glycosyltransferase n=1 Tax=Flagellimonas sp. TaxID=2058762 RepID=UPI003BAF2D55
MISSVRYWFLIALILVVYVAGLFVTLFENDSAQFAVMAMRMVQENDFFTLIKGTEEYLDKPHMHYWLAAFSYKLFGIHDWAYRIPGVLAIFLGAYSCFGLGKLLYNKDVGRLSALIFLTAQTIVLSGIDVRTDAVLTGFAIFAIWQLALYVEKNTLTHVLLGAFGAGLAFSTKGQIALVVIGMALLCHLAYTRKWNRLWSWKIFLALLVFGITIAPMLYAYYLQFDLHPEKVIRGRDHRSGIFFILWEQSFERMSGQGVGKNSSDFFFFFHTFLWVFLPWTVLALMAYWSRVKVFIKMRFKYHRQFEFLTLGGITILFFLISLAQFKLPHYINILIPLYAILSASYLYKLYKFQKRKVIKTILGIQYFILSLVFITTVLICFYAFRFEKTYCYFLLIALLGIITYFCLKREVYYLRIITISVCSSMLLNAVLNMHFYPNLLTYQAGSTMAGLVEKEQIPVDEIYKISERHTWALDFYNQHPVKVTSISDLENKKGIWIYLTDSELEQMVNSGYHWHEQITVDQFRITRLQLKFLNPNTRAKKLNKMHLVQLD